MKRRLFLTMTAALALAGFNQYSTPSVDRGGPDSGAVPLNNQADPSDTTGSVGGSPGGTSSLQTVPSSSDGVR